MISSSLRSALFALSIGLFIQPDISGAQDHIFVSSRGSDEVRIYNAKTGEFERTLFQATGTWVNTQEVLFGPDGMLYVTFVNGSENGAIHRFDPKSGEYLGAFTSGYDLDRPTKMKISPDGHFYVSQWGNTKFDVAVFDGKTGEFIREATSNPMRMNVQAVAWDDQGRLYVSNYGNGRDGAVRRYNASGTVDDTVIDSDILQGPVNIWFGEDGLLNVVDWSRGRVEAFDTESGQVVRTLASGMQSAEGWTFGPDGLLYICAWHEGKVNRYDPTSGELVDTFIDDPELSQPNSITFSPPADTSNTTRSN